MDQTPVPLAGAVRRRLITEDIWECLMDDAFICPHALRFRNGFFCRQTTCLMPGKRDGEDAP